jgi:hypothetical protein
MTIASVRIFYYPGDEARERQLTFSHWGFAEWFTRRLKPIREQLRGPEAKGVNIMNLMLYEHRSVEGRWDEWWQRANTFEYSTLYDLRSLENAPAIANIPRLMQFYSRIADHAPWPQARAVAAALRQPFTEVDKITLAPYLCWPRGKVISEAKAAKLAGALPNTSLERTLER